MWIRASAVSTLVIIFLSQIKVQANVVGVGTQNFNSITSGLDFVTVQSSETLRPGILNFGLFFNYAVNSLPYFESTPGGRTKYADSLLSADYNLGIGLLKNWDVGISVPTVLSQDVKDNDVPRGEFLKNGFTETRINTKYRLFGDESGGLALVGSTNFHLTVNDPFAGQGAGPTYNLELAGDTTWNRIAFGLNLGHRWRNSGTPLSNTPIQPLGNQYLASVAASYLLSTIDTKLITEIFTSFPAQNRSSDLDRTLQSAEWIVGAKHDFTTQLAGHVGVGTELWNGVASPDWRIYTGLNYVIGPVWSQREESKLPPPEIPVVGERPVERFIVKNIQFEFNSANMVGDFAKILDDLSSYIVKVNFRELVIEGHTDSVGGEEYNQRLSEKRANAIRDYLIQKKQLDGKKIKAAGYGETQPIADNGNYQGRQINRRVEFRVTRARAKGK